MSAVVLVVPGSIETRTGGYEYDRRMAEALRARGWTVHICELDDGFPLPTPAQLERARRALAAIPDGATVLVDGLALGVMPEEAEREAARLRIVALVHLPLAAEPGIRRELAWRFEATERRALAAARLVVVTGRSTVDALERYGVDRERVVAVEPGTVPAPLARGSVDGPLQLLSVAAVTPGKGHDTLFRALASIPNRRWRLTCAGTLERHPPTVARMRSLLREQGLDNQVWLGGELSEGMVADSYNRADVFVHASLHETYGMVVAEALARGLPVVATNTGAIPDLIGDGAGLLVRPGDVDALAVAIRQVMEDRELRERLAAGARRVRDRLPTWDRAAERMAAALERIAV
jgi:glycosyltransferase involved in cell wall biosynthesis